MIWYLRIMIYTVKMLYTHTEISVQTHTFDPGNLRLVFTNRQNESDLVTDFVAETHSREV